MYIKDRMDRMDGDYHLSGGLTRQQCDIGRRIGAVRAIGWAHARGIVRRGGHPRQRNHYNNQDNDQYRYYVNNARMVHFLTEANRFTLLDVTTYNGKTS